MECRPSVEVTIEENMDPVGVGILVSPGELGRDAVGSRVPCSESYVEGIGSIENSDFGVLRGRLTLIRFQLDEIPRDWSSAPDFIVQDSVDSGGIPLDTDSRKNEMRRFSADPGFHSRGRLFCGHLTKERTGWKEKGQEGRDGQ